MSDVSLAFVTFVINTVIYCIGYRLGKSVSVSDRLGQEVNDSKENFSRALKMQEEFHRESMEAIQDLHWSWLADKHQELEVATEHVLELQNRIKEYEGADNE